MSSRIKQCLFGTHFLGEYTLKACDRASTKTGAEALAGLSAAVMSKTRNRSAKLSPE